MTREILELLHDTGAFNPSPRQQTLYTTHVRFDTRPAAAVANMC